MGSLEIYDSFQPYSDSDENSSSIFSDIKPDTVNAARAAIERFRERHGRKPSRAGVKTGGDRH